ncbi:glycoside hydrolase family 38 N-terminal domain-containing protein [Cohnella fermenti]|uniref:glycoside hydrolase family 38 N-terminal domain-containing protein n=1 Tax=Cohnella fermenti TaxID=2565925 RepID=UPI001454D2E6|nr:glycosyl hydrolase-related protein [Cohnella fermenti]
MRIQGIRQTAFIDYQDRNKVWVLFSEDIVMTPSYLTVYVGDRLVYERKKFIASPCELLLPLVETTTDCTLELYDDLERTDAYRCKLEPVKQWKIALMTSSHEDLGYCEYVNRLEEGCAGFLDEAMDIMDRDGRYKYVIEHYWWLRAYENCRDEERQARLRRYMDSGHIALATPHSGVHTHWQGYEELPRSLYYARRYAREKWGIDPKTAIHADLSGVSWSAVSAYRNAGIRYLLSLPNDFRDSKDAEEAPQCFWWRAPGGKDRLLVWTQRHYMQDDLRQAIHDTSWYYESDEFRAEAKQDNIEKAIDKLFDRLGDVPYDLLPVSYYYDRRKPTTVLLLVIDSMRAKWKHPVFEMGLPDEFMGYLEERFGDQLPELAGDLTDQWADFATIAPRWLAKKREGEALFGMAEALSSLNLAAGRADMFPKATLDEALWSMLEFDEHCWATSIKDPFVMHKYNLKLVKEQTAIRAKRNVDDVIRRALLPSGDGCYAWNPLPYPRTEAIRLPLEEGDASVPIGVGRQRLPNGILTEPIPLPAFGIVALGSEPKAMAGERPKAVASKSEAGEGFARVEGGAIDTGHYIVWLDTDSGKIRNILDKASGHELLDEHSRYRLGDFIYYTCEEKASRSGTHEDVHKVFKISIRNGPLAVSIVMEGGEEQSGATVKNTVTFYKHDRTIDVELIFEGAAALMGDFYDRYKKNVFYAFPFRVPGFRFFTELAGGVVDEERDRLALHTNDFVIPQNWVSAENEAGGIALFTREMPVFHLGAIHLNRFSSTKAKPSSSIFLHAMSNRCNNLSLHSPEDCGGEFRLSILPYAGSWRASVPEWSLGRLYPPVAGRGAVAETGSVLALDRRNVRLLALKPAEDGDGFIVRFMELTGERTSASLTLPFGVADAVYTNVVEENTGEAALAEGRIVAFDIEPYSYATLRIRPLERVPFRYEEKERAAVRNVFAMPTVAGRTMVSWEKGDHRAFDSFEIRVNGERAAVVGNEALTVQWAELDADPNGEFSVEGRRRER